MPFLFPRPVISSSVLGGGMSQAGGIINHQVASHSIDVNREDDPSQYLSRLAKRLGIEGQCVGLMTAVDLSCLVLTRVESSGIWIEGFFTVGITNAVRAGESTSRALLSRTQHKAGTINIILVTNARLSQAAMVGAVGVATESKTATLLDEGIMNMSGKLLATGTGTDAIALATGDGYYCRYSGTHTKLGELIGRLVSDGVKQGLQKDRAWRATSI
ncbi:MAG: adenosylcobinamide amidohydrolase [Nitrospirales bacterium]